MNLKLGIQINLVNQESKYNKSRKRSVKRNMCEDTANQDTMHEGSNKERKRVGFWCHVQ